MSGNIHRIYRTARPRYWRHFNPEKYGQGLKGLLKQAYNEIPIVFVAGVIFLGTLPPAMYRVYQLYTNEEDYYRRYKMDYTVVRDDDPLAGRILKPNPNIKFREYADY